MADDLIQRTLCTIEENYPEANSIPSAVKEAIVDLAEIQQTSMPQLDSILVISNKTLHSELAYSRILDEEALYSSPISNLILIGEDYASLISKDAITNKADFDSALIRPLSEVKLWEEVKKITLYLF